MKTKLLLVCFLVLFCMGKAQIVNIPDANFKSKLLESSANNQIAQNLSGSYFAIDANNDGEIQVSEALQVKELKMIYPNTFAMIQSYDGILSFANIKSLTIDYANVPSDPFVISNLTSLNTLNVKFGNYDPGTIKVSGCPALKNLSIYGIILETLSNNPLIENFSLYSQTVSNEIITEIEHLTHLKNLEFREFIDGIGNAYLDLSNHPNLLSLNVICTNLNVNVSGCPLLNSITLNATDDPYNFIYTPSVKINSSNCPSLVNYTVGEYFDIVAEIISDNCPGLLNFSSEYGDVTLSFNSCINLKTIDVRNLRTLSVNNCSNLETIKALRFRDTSLDLSNKGLNSLKNLEISYISPFSPSIVDSGSLTNLNVQGITSLEVLECANHEITNLNVAGCTGLQTLDCSKNKLPTLDLGSATNLQTVDCSNNLLTSLLIKNGMNETVEFLNNPDLMYICCDNSQMQDIQNQAAMYGYTNCIIDGSCNAALASIESGPKTDENKISIYPVPAKDEITIKVEANIISVALYDAQGRILKQEKTDSKSTKINMQSYPSGVYYLKINTEKGSILKKAVKS